MISCEKENFEPVNTSSINTSNISSSSGSSSDKCISCSEWQSCKRVGSSDPLDFFNTSYSYQCRSIFRNLNQGRYTSVQTFSDSLGNIISNNLLLYFPFIADGSSTFLDIQYYNTNTTKIRIYFTSDYDIPNYFNFNISNCVIFNPLTQSDMIFDGIGSFTKNGSSPYYTVNLNLKSTLQNGNFSFSLVGVSDS